MPRDSTIINIQLNNIISCLTPAIDTLNELHDGFGTPFVQATSNTTLSLISMVQVINVTHSDSFSNWLLKNVKRNRDKCIQCMENIYELICAIVNVHIEAEPVGTQKDGNKIKHFFRQSQMNTLLKECQAGLYQGLEVFKVKTAVIVLADTMSIQKKTENMHQELLELISILSSETISDRSSSTYHSSISTQNSSSSSSMLPPQPKIFHGREVELQAIVDKLSQEPARIAILGTGGMGKTSLARAALHHPDVAIKYEHRFFVTCDSVTTSINLTALIGSHIGLKPGNNMIQPVVKHISQASSGLLVTMRGTERAGKVRWTHPFLGPLEPLSDHAARQTFIEIADDWHDDKHIDQVLHLTDNVPLAIYLMAHLVDYEGCPNILYRWASKKTTLFSTEHDKQTNLDGSIAISLSSPRMVACPGAENLLSLLSILPDGISEIELVESHLPIQNILACRATLVCTALAYYDHKKRLKSLVPIREHVHHFYPPSYPLFHSLTKYFQVVLDLYEKYHGLQQNSARVSQITSNLGNLQQLLLLELQPDNPDVAQAINCTISLSSFQRSTSHGRTILMEHVPPVFPQPCDHHLKVKFIIERLSSQ
ncbi:hypothetical protein C8R44DRAFT_731537 [Mycena epipterygia]|nr:hypothetical protein C8R44DRAFT_731537 [Mycena epipterygia]